MHCFSTDHAVLSLLIPLSLLIVLSNVVTSPAV
jgi:hypothetical protein